MLLRSFTEHPNIEEKYKERAAFYIQSFWRRISKKINSKATSSKISQS